MKTTLFLKYLFATIAIVVVAMWTIGELLLLSDAIAKQSASRKAPSSVVVATGSAMTLPSKTALLIKTDETDASKDEHKSVLAQPAQLPRLLPESPIGATSVTFAPAQSM